MADFAPTRLDDRAVLRLTGPERQTFLEGLLTNKVANMQPGEARYAALLTPQGKLIAEMIAHATTDTLYLDVPAATADALLRRLMMYKLRADVSVEDAADLAVVAAPSDPGSTVAGTADPRDPALGWRGIMVADKAPAADDQAAAQYRQKRYGLGIGEGAELGVEKDFWLETGAERQNGVAFDKGCYVGQELTARMKHRSKPKKMLVPATLDGSLADELPMAVKAGDKPAGEIRATGGTTALLFLKLDRAGDRLATESGISVTPDSAYVPD